MAFVRLVKKVVIGILVVGILGITLWTWGSLKFSYSNGERAGYVQKFSKKGWLFKTWEGELAMVNLPGAMPEKFFFTVRNKTTADKIMKGLGSRVVLKYEEHRFVPSRIFGETPYYVIDVRVVEDPNAVAR